MREFREQMTQLPDDGLSREDDQPLSLADLVRTPANGTSEFEVVRRIWGCQ